MVIYKLTGTEKETMKEEISSLLKKREEIIFSYIHGSFLEGDFRNIDMAIYLKDEKNTMQYELKIEREIEDVTGFPVDVRILNRAPLSFRFNVIKNGFLLFSRDEKTRCDFESLIIVEYHDFDFMRNIYRREALIFDKQVPSLGKKYRLLPSDALHVSVMKSNNISNIATRDGDFERVEDIKVWCP